MKFDSDQAVETVMQEIWRNGYEAASVKALSERLSITRSSFYNAFGSREALFRKVLQRYGAQSPDRVLYEMTRDTPLIPVLNALFREIARVRAADPEARGCLAVNTLIELSPEHTELGPEMCGLMQASLGQFETLLGWARDRGEIPPDSDVRGLALALKNLLLGLNVLSKVVHDEDALWQTANITLTALGLSDEATT